MPAASWRRGKSTAHRRWPLVSHPARIAFNAALRFVAIGHIGGDGRQLTASAGDDATDEGRQGGQVLGDAALASVGIPLLERIVYGTILAKIVTDRVRLLVEGTSQGVYDVTIFC